MVDLSVSKTQQTPRTISQSTDHVEKISQLNQQLNQTRLPGVAAGAVTGTGAAGLGSAQVGP